MKYLLVIVFALGLSACAYGPNHKPIEGQLLTHIREDGTKLFLFTSIGLQRLPAMGRANPQPRNRAMQGRQAPPDYRARMKENLYKSLALKLEQTGYCRKGYIPLGSYIEMGQFEIRGECNEIATEQDKLLFPGNRMGQYQ